MSARANLLSQSAINSWSPERFQSLSDRQAITTLNETLEWYDSYAEFYDGAASGDLASRQSYEIFTSSVRELETMYQEHLGDTVNGQNLDPDERDELLRQERLTDRALTYLVEHADPPQILSSAAVTKPAKADAVARDTVDAQPAAKIDAGSELELDAPEVRAAFDLGKRFGAGGDAAAVDAWTAQLDVNPEQTYGFMKGVEHATDDPTGRLTTLNEDTLDRLDYGFGYLGADERTSPNSAKFDRFKETWQKLGARGEGADGRVTKAEDIALRKQLQPYGRMVSNAAQQKRDDASLSAAALPPTYSADEVLGGLRHPSLEVVAADRSTETLTIQYGMSFGGGTRMTIQKQGRAFQVGDSVFAPGDANYDAIRRQFAEKITRTPDAFTY